MSGRNSILVTTRTPLVDLERDAAGGGVPGPGGSGASPAEVAFNMEQQEQTEWCWAAVAVSVAAFYNGSGIWRQCALVNAEFGLTTCCVDGSAPACNRPW
jgi:hypothetical protein